MISLVITMRDGRTAEVATVGREGVAGKAGFGADGSVARGIVQIPGRATRVGAGRLRAVVVQSEPLRDLLQRHADALYGQTAQSAACYALHPAEARCCRFVLQAHDRARGDVLGLTQELLAEMLGVQRSTVSLVAGAVQRAGLIRYSRGSVTVLDRAGLEEASCECYGAIRRRFERLLPHTYE